MVKKRNSLLEKKELNKVLKQINEKSMKNILHLNFIKRDQKAKSIILKGLKKKIKKKLRKKH